MYIRITSRCNMTCEHCCYSCTAHGEDMTLETFRNTIAHCDCDYVCLGGGEPTIHPLFEQMLLEAITDTEGVFVITNGKATRRALMLAKLADKKVISAQLSRDSYHDDIDDEVVDAFASLTGGIRDTSQGGSVEPLPHGRGHNLNPIELEDRDRSDCPCNELLVQPNGDVHLCGCDDSPCIGNVNTGFEIPDWYEPCECYHGMYYRNYDEILI